MQQYFIVSVSVIPKRKHDWAGANQVLFWYDNGNLSHLPGDDDLLRQPLEINKRLFIDDEQPIVISIG